MYPIQYKISTFARREEKLFLSARARFAQTRHTQIPRILSFGCSIGDEIASLRLVFPDSVIVGCDVDEVALEAAQRTVGHFSTIVRSEESILGSFAPFDFISACSVLCLNPKPKDFATRFPVSRFDDALGLLDSILAPRGLLGITNSSYRFHDSPVAQGYDIVRSDAIHSSGFVDVMNRDGSALLIQAQAPAGPYFRRGKGFFLNSDEELADVLFEKRMQGSAATHWVRISEPPPDWASTGISYERTNMDSLGEDAPSDAIAITARHEFGYTSENCESGIVSEMRWPSILGGYHVRPKTWSSLGSASSRRSGIG